MIYMFTVVVEIQYPNLHYLLKNISVLKKNAILSPKKLCCFYTTENRKTDFCFNP